MKLAFKACSVPHDSSIRFWIGYGDNPVSIFSSLAAYGAYIRPMPYSNEIGLRMLIGGAVREASVLGYRVTPLFSYYSYHGPVFRVLLRMNRGKLQDNRWLFGSSGKIIDVSKEIFML